MRYMAAALVAICSFGCEGKSYLGAGEAGGSNEGGAPGQSPGGSAGDAGGRTGGKESDDDRGSAGTTVSTGGRASTGDRGSAGTTAGNASRSYPEAPTLPLDPDCTCSSKDEVCNAAGECVPRCDAQGRCATWLVHGAAQSLYAEGSTLYFVTPPESDPLGNLLSLGTLWRVGDSDLEPKRISNTVGSADAPPEELSIIGRTASATYVTACSSNGCTICEVTDAGVVRALAQSEWFEHAVVLPNAVFYLTEAGLSRLGFEPDAVPELMIGAPDVPPERNLTAADRVWYWSGDQMYVFDPDSAPAEAAASAVEFLPNDIDHVLAGVEGNVAYIATVLYYRTVTSYDDTGRSLLLLFKGSDDARCLHRLTGSWVYSWCRQSGEPNVDSLVRSPTTVGRLPQEVLPPQLVKDVGPWDSIGTETLWAVGDKNSFWAVGDDAVYWVQVFEPEDTARAAAHYIFRAPLPSDLCDDELPCRKDGEHCGPDGVCVE